MGAVVAAVLVALLIIAVIVALVMIYLSRRRIEKVWEGTIAERESNHATYVLCR